MPKFINCLTEEGKENLLNIMHDLDPFWEPNDREPVEIELKEVEKEMKRIPKKGGK